MILERHLVGGGIVELVVHELLLRVEQTVRGRYARYGIVLMRYLKAKAWVPSTCSAWEKHTASPAAEGAYFTLKSADCSLCAGSQRHRNSMRYAYATAASDGWGRSFEENSLAGPGDGQSSLRGTGVTSEILAGERVGREADVDGRGEDRQRQDEHRSAHRRVRKNAERKGRADDKKRASVMINVWLVTTRRAP